GRGLLAAGAGTVAAGLVRAVLAGVEGVKSHEVAELQVPVELQVPRRRELRTPERHRVIVRLEGGGAAQEEDLWRRIVLIDLRGPVVVDFVVVPGHDERRRGVD